MRESWVLSWNRNRMSRDRSIESYFLGLGTLILLMFNNSRLHNFGGRMIVAVVMIDCISMLIFLESKMRSGISSLRLFKTDRFLLFD